MKTLIIPDLHNNVDWVEGFLKSQKYDQVVFLGDYFDDFGDGAAEAKKTALWLKKMLRNNKAIFLLGNHDMGYMFPDNIFLKVCPGFSEEKSHEINKVLTKEDWKKFKLMTEVDGWVLSHAGAHPQLFTDAFGRVTPLSIDLKCMVGLAMSGLGVANSTLGWGASRGGWQRYGGIIWLDWDELLPIPGINQIVGHTPGEQVREKSGPKSVNYCIDADCQFVGVIEKRKFRVIKRE